jgi:single-strand DNA-binding protein
MYLNSVQLIGFIGKDPERRVRQSAENGTEAVYVVFSIATQQSWKNADGEWQKRTEWHRITAWSVLGERAAENLRSGDHVLIRGRFVSATYDRQYGDDDNPVVVKQTFWQVRFGRNEFPSAKLVRAEGLEPSRGLRPNGFSYPPRLSPPCPVRVVGDAPGRFVVWTIPSP